MDAIIYTTNTGSTGQYAKLLAQETGLPAYSLVEAKKRVFAGAEVVYLGWIMAGSVKGCAGAAKRYQVCAVCGVGMGQTGTQTDSVRKKSEIPANIPLFTLQGNFNVKKLHGIYRFMMEIMVKTVGKGLAAKKDCTPEEDDMLDMMLHGGRAGQGRKSKHHSRLVQSAAINVLSESFLHLLLWMVFRCLRKGNEIK